MVCSPKIHDEKRFEIKGGGQEMTVMTANGKNFNDNNPVESMEKVTQFDLDCCY